jgi:osmotically-inducible protein OsmY
VQSVRNELSVAMQAYEYPALGYVPGQGQENLSRNIGEQQQTTGERPATKQPPTTGQQQAGLSDMVLARRVALELQQQLPGNQIIYVLDQQAIDIMVTQGTVTLYGSVRTQSRKQHAEQIVRSIRQVLNVRNDLTVAGGAGEYPPLGYVPGQQDQGRQQQQQDRRVSGDAQCVQTLKQNITGRNLQDMAQNIYVICHDGEMALYGYVPSEEDRDRLGRIAAQIEGVTKVDNNIAVRRQGEEQKSDKQIKEDIESRLWWSPFVDSDKIDVSVENGTVTLSGEVEDWNAEKAAIKSAFDGGARRVKSRLQVKNQERGPQAGTTDDQQDDAAAQQQSRADQP